MKNMNTQKPLKSKVSITLDEEVIKRIKDLAEADDRNFSQYINLVLKKHIERESGSDHSQDKYIYIPNKYVKKILTEENLCEYFIILRL